MDYLIRESIRRKLKKIPFDGCGVEFMGTECPNLVCGINIGGEQIEDNDISIDFYCPSLTCKINL